ncbi:MAG: SdpI family protein [Anaerolineae bacterium]|nr:SdpI family protein [Anaerolineae bacterium]
MITRRTGLGLLMIVLLMLAASALTYPVLPERVATHWNAQGQADGYGSRFLAVSFLPLLTAGIVLLLSFLPAIDPLKTNLYHFRREYNGFVLLFAGFMAYIHFLTLAWNLGWQIDMVRAFVPAFAILSYFIGALLSKARRNWFVGIRTPWTLSSDVVWERTHRAASLWFKLAAAVSLLGLLFARFAFLFVIVPLLLVALAAVVLSYIEYLRLTSSGTD